MALNRRDLVMVAALSGLAGPVPAAFAQSDDGGTQLDDGGGALRFGEPRPFAPSQVRSMARELASRPYQAPADDVPGDIRDLSYDQYRDIRYRPDMAVWHDAKLPAEIQMFHLGHVFEHPVLINVVAEGNARHVVFAPELFDYGPLVPMPIPAEDVGFSGFRLHGPLNRADHNDEFAVFQGASYFRAVGRDQVYGLSARGLSLRTAEPEGEEFPAFREFWIERPRSGASSVVVHALLDSPSTTGAYRFTIRPGMDTVIDVEATLYPRVEIHKVGLATLTSMFYFGPQDRLAIDDFRPAVHDSDGLLIWNGRGEWLWRPLINPARLQVSAFLDENPQAFGLMQRGRDFDRYQDLEARYERRPSLWVEPIGDWGEGAVTLVEIPTDSEIHDNIVAFWRPKVPLMAGDDHMFTYRLTWCAEAPADSGLARVTGTMIGGPAANGGNAPADRRWIVIDFAGGPLDGFATEDQPVPDVSASGGRLVPGTIQFNPETGGRRVAFGLDPEGATNIDLRCALVQDGRRLSEVWVFRWSE